MFHIKGQVYEMGSQNNYPFKRKRIAVSFEKEALLIERIKKVNGARWSQSKNFWHIPDTAENRIRFKIARRRQLMCRQWWNCRNFRNGSALKDTARIPLKRMEMP